MVAAAYADADPSLLLGSYGYAGLPVAIGKSAPCVNAANIPVPCNGGAVLAAPALIGGYAGRTLWKRDAEADADADASILYGGYGLSYAGYAPAIASYSTLARPTILGGLAAGRIWKREAEAEADADASILYGGYAGYAGYAAPALATTAAIAPALATTAAVAPALTTTATIAAAPSLTTYSTLAASNVLGGYAAAPAVLGGAIAAPAVLGGYAAAPLASTTLGLW